MAENDKNKSKLGEVGDVLKAALDPITKFWEGVAQIGFEIFKDRGIIEILVLYLVGLVTFDVFMTRLEDLVKKDGNKRKVARADARYQFFLLCKDVGGVALKAAFNEVGKGYNYLKKRKLMSDNDLKDLLKKLDDFSENSKKQREQSLNRRKWYFRIGVPALITLLFCAASDPKYLPWIGGVIVALLIVVGGVIMFQNKAPEAPAPPVRRIS